MDINRKNFLKYSFFRNPFSIEITVLLIDINIFIFYVNHYAFTLRTSNSDVWIENLLASVLLLSTFKTTIYSKCLLMQYSIIMHLKYQNH